MRNVIIENENVCRDYAFLTHAAATPIIRLHFLFKIIICHANIKAKKWQDGETRQISGCIFSKLRKKFSWSNGSEFGAEIVPQ